MEKPSFAKATYSYDLSELERVEVTDIQRESMQRFVKAWMEDRGPKRPLTTYAPALDRKRMGYFWQSSLDVA